VTKVEIKTKICTKCKRELLIDNFGIPPKSRGRLNSQCKDCRTETTNAWKVRNLERIRKTKRAWVLKNPEKVREHMRTCQIVNPIRAWVRGSLGSHRARGFKMKISIDELEKVARNISRCPYCNVELDWLQGNKGHVKPKSPSLDRIHNGNVIDENSIQIICNRCNTIKGNEFGDDLRCRLITMLKYIQGGSQKEIPAGHGLGI